MLLTEALSFSQRSLKFSSLGGVGDFQGLFLILSYLRQAL